VWKVDQKRAVFVFFAKTHRPFGVQGGELFLVATQPEVHLLGISLRIFFILIDHDFKKRGARIDNERF
jgi:hypothetical protein